MKYLEILERFADFAIAETDIDEVSQTIVEMLVDHFNADFGYSLISSHLSNSVKAVNLVNINALDIPIARKEGMGIEKELAQDFFNQNKTDVYVWPGGKHDRLHKPYPNKEILSELICPLISNHKLFGFLVLSSDTPNFFDSNDSQKLYRLVNLITSSRGKVSTSVNLRRVSSFSLSVSSIYSLSSDIAKTIKEAFGFSAVCVWVRQQKINNKVLQLTGESGTNIQNRSTFDMILDSHKGISWETIIDAENAREKDLFDLCRRENISTGLYEKHQHPEWLEANEIRSMISIPLRMEGYVFGVINVYSKQNYHFPDTELKLLAIVSRLSTMALKVVHLTTDLNQERKRLGDYSSEVIKSMASETARLITNRIDDYTYESILKIRSETEKFLINNTTNGDAILREIDDLSANLKSCMYILENICEPEKLGPIDVKRVIENAVHFFERFGDYQLVIHTDIKKIPLIKGNLSEFSVLIYNILFNAYRSIIRAERDTGIIQVECFQQQESMLIRFEDNGIGLGEKRYQAVIDSDKCEPEDLGITLYYLVFIVKKYKGKLRLNNEFGSGLQIEISLPISHGELAHD